MLLNVLKLFKLSVNFSSNCSLGDSEGSSDLMTRNLPVCRSGGGGRSYWFVRPSRVKTVQNRVYNFSIKRLEQGFPLDWIP